MATEFTRPAFLASPVDTDTITPFTIAVPDADLADLHRRLDRTRWPRDDSDANWERGVPIAYLRDLVEYWRHQYDWRRAEAALNALPLFTTTIDGANIMFVQVRSAVPGALPLVISHGWPGSILELVDLIGPLTDPAAHGGDAADAFDVVIPALPGFGLSGPLPDGGWDAARMGAALASLMHRLGYDHFGAQGGDQGAVVSPALGQADADSVVGVHVNAATTGFIPWHEVAGEELASLTPREQERVAAMAEFMQQEAGYMMMQGTRPQTIAYSLADSPVGQLAWIIEKFKTWSSHAANLPEDIASRDTLLTNVMFYWLTNTGGSSAQSYFEAQAAMNAAGDGADDDGSDGEDNTDPAASGPDAATASDQPTGAPLAVANFDRDVAIRRYADPTFNIVRWTEFDTGGHFAALETPDLLVDDVRAFFRPLRPAAASR